MCYVPSPVLASVGDTDDKLEDLEEANPFSFKEFLKTKNLGLSKENTTNSRIYSKESTRHSLGLDHNSPTSQTVGYGLEYQQPFFEDPTGAGDLLDEDEDEDDRWNGAYLPSAVEQTHSSRVAASTSPCSTYISFFSNPSELAGPESLPAWTLSDSDSRVSPAGSPSADFAAHGESLGDRHLRTLQISYEAAQVSNFKRENEALRAGQGASLTVVKQNTDVALQNLRVVMNNAHTSIKFRKLLLAEGFWYTFQVASYTVRCRIEERGAWAEPSRGSAPCPTARLGPKQGGSQSSNPQMGHPPLTLDVSGLQLLQPWGEGLLGGGVGREGLHEVEAMDIDAEREKISKEIKELERILDPQSSSISVDVSASSLDSDSDADSLPDEDSDAAAPLISEEERWGEASNDEDDPKEKALPEDPETCLQLNMVYQEVIQEKLAEVSLLLAQNREQQEEVMWDLAGSKGPKVKDGRSLPPNLYIGHFMKPYFKDKVTGVGPPANKDTREKAAQGIKAFEQLLVTKWKNWEKALLRKSVVSDRLQRLLQPKLLKLEYLHQKQSRVTSETERQVLEKQAREAEKEIQDINQLPEEALLGSRLDSHDWEKISNVNFEGGRSAEEIRKFWQNCEHPSINKQEWMGQEVEQLKAIAARHGHLDWQKIAEELGTCRSAFQCLQKYQQHNKALKRKEWTEEEDHMLTQLVQEMRVGSHIPYRRIVYYMEGRDSMQLIYRWTKSLDPSLKKGFWTPEEDAKLLRAVAKYGEQDWFKIREEVPGRSDAQCRDRCQASASTLPAAAHHEGPSTRTRGKSCFWASHLGFVSMCSILPAGCLLQNVPARGVAKKSASHEEGAALQPHHAKPTARVPPPALSGPRPKPKTVSELLREKRLWEARARKAAQSRVVLPPQVLVSSPVVLQPLAPQGPPVSNAVLSGPGGPAVASLSAPGSWASASDERPPSLQAFALTPASTGARTTPAASRAPALGPSQGPVSHHLSLLGQSQAPATSRKQGLPEAPPFLPAAPSPAQLPAQPLSLIPALGTHGASTPLPVTWVLTAQGLLPVPVPAVVGLPTSAGTPDPRGLSVTPPPSLTEPPAAQGPGLSGQPPANMDTASDPPSGTDLLTLPRPSTSQSPTEVDSTRAQDPEGLSSPPEVQVAGETAVPRTFSQAMLLAHHPEAEPSQSSQLPLSGGSGPGETPGPGEPRRPQPGPEKGALDLGLLSQESEAAVREWLRGRCGVCVPPLGSRLPYQPPTLCSLRVLSGLLLRKKDLEQRAAALVPGRAAGALQASLQQARERLQDSPAHLLLKARFLAAFTLPALLATLSPPSVPTTLSAAVRAEPESDDDDVHKDDSGQQRGWASSAHASPAQSLLRLHGLPAQPPPKTTGLPGPDLHRCCQQDWEPVPTPQDADGGFADSDHVVTGSAGP
ncbi:snRNA-activating protein complex subunit 4-like protein [Camelus ferus]|nr:snRNA-activating protein complex subunit 4-like protein [Camelus ferus]